MLRRARHDDAHALAAIFRASYGTLTFLPTLHTPEEDRRHFERVVAEREVWVATEGDVLVGFAALTDDQLTDIYVDAQRLGNGIGTRLLELAKERRPAGFRLWVFQRNERARRFYEGRGFRLVELTDGAGNEEGEPDALYEWSPARG